MRFPFAMVKLVASGGISTMTGVVGVQRVGMKNHETVLMYS